ncbi:hypothetical protein J6590_098844 [Homalodisca vitripennis]|nr:hypothetical protein J6590_098844 [Homalodisca vitripennis]
MGPGGEDEDEQECPDNEQIIENDKQQSSLFRFFCSVIPIHRLLRDHHYIGPNVALVGVREDPVDEDDRIAAQHTKDYQNARSWEDVRKADRLALRCFWRDLVSNWNWHSAVLLLLLCAKYMIECVVSSPIYPCDLTGTPQCQGTNPVKSTTSVRANQMASSQTLPPGAQCQSQGAPLFYMEADEDVYEAIDDMRYKIQDVRNHIFTSSLEDPDVFEKEIDKMTCRVQQLEHLVASQDGC